MNEITFWSEIAKSGYSVASYGLPPIINVIPRYYHQSILQHVHCRHVPSGCPEEFDPSPPKWRVGALHF